MVVRKHSKVDKAVKASQIAFQLEQEVAKRISRLAVSEGLTTSGQIRKIIGLPYCVPKRPRLTVSLSEEDYKALSKKYNVDPENTLEIKRKIMNELICVSKLDQN